MSVLRRLYRGENDFDFLGRRRWGYAFSAFLLAIGGISLFTRALDLGIEFEGGISWDVPAEDVSVEDTRDALAPVGLENAKIQILGADTIRVQATEEAIEAGQEEDVADALAELAGVDSQDVSINEVGPSWGDEITDKAVRALVYFLIAIAIYISLRFEWRMALAALGTVIHDVLITVGIYSVSGFEVTPATVIAFLTILGYSLYDTIVVFDKVQENVKLIGGTGRMTFTGVVNLSMNEVIMRSVNTGITSVLPVVSMLLVGANLLGAVTLQEFALALLIGLAVGVYSSIFVASPLLCFLKEREPRYATIRARLEATGAERPVLTPSGGRPSLEDEDAEEEAEVEVPVETERPAARRPPPRVYGQPGAPRGRKRRRRK